MPSLSGDWTGALVLLAAGANVHMKDKVRGKAVDGGGLASGECGRGEEDGLAKSMSEMSEANQLQ